MNSENTARRPMSSYSREVVNMNGATTPLQLSAASGRSVLPEPQSYLDFSPEVRPHYSCIPPFVNDDSTVASNPPTMLLHAHRYPEPSQRTDHRPGRDRTQNHSSMVAGDGGSGDDSNAALSNQVAFQRYPSASEANSYPSDLDTQFSDSSSPLSLEDVATGITSLMDYNNALREYHHVRSQKLQPQQVFQDRVVQSDAPDLIPNSRTQMRQDQPPISSYNSTYNNVNGLRDNSSSHPNDSSNLVTASMREPSHTVHALTSIPMCNPSALPPHNLHPHSHTESSARTHNSLHNNLDLHNQVQQNAVQPGSLYQDFCSSDLLKETLIDSAPSQSDTMQQPNSHLAPQADGYLSIDLEEQDEQVDGDIGVEQRSPRDVADSSTSATTNKKKSKMHECPICNKKFPRPSGLKTHMNTHSNERPFACEFPGCTRTFGVRSNARRHLRTHGVVPTPSRASGEAPYVVGFSTPMIMPPPERSTSESSSDVLQQVAGDNGEREGPGGSSGRRERGSFRATAYKVRWLQPSSTKRTNATEPPDIRDGRIMQAGAGTGSGASQSTSGTSGSDVTGGSGLQSGSSFVVAPTMSSSSAYSASTSSSPATSFTPIPSSNWIGRDNSRTVVQSRNGSFHTDTDSHPSQRANKPRR